jgi:cytochrome P450
MSASPERNPFDHHSEDFARNWPEVYRQLRAECPVAYTDRHNGFFAITLYDDVLAVLREHKSASSGREMIGNRPSPDHGVTIPTNPFRMGIMEMDPPQSTRYRRILTPWFSRSAVDGMTPRIRELATWCIDRFIDRGEFDVIDDLANPLPALVTLDLLGIPLNRWRRYARVMHEAVYREPGSADSIRSLLDDLGGVVDDCGEPGGLIEYLRAAEVDGDRLPKSLVVELVFMLLNGGTDTTTALIGNLMLHLDTERTDRERLVANPDLIGSAVQEFIRFYAPATGVARTVTAPIVLSGVALGLGERMLLALGSANRDEHRFPNADRAVIDRDPNPHLAFGSGLHRCLGADIASREIEVLLDEFLRRCGDYTVDQSDVVSYPRVPLVNGFVSMPARFTPGPRLLDAAASASPEPVLREPRRPPIAVPGR